MAALRSGLPPLAKISITNDTTTSPRMMNDSGRIHAARSLLIAKPSGAHAERDERRAAGGLRDDRRPGSC